MPTAFKQIIDKDELAKLDSQFLSWTPEDCRNKWREWVEIFATTSPSEEYALRYSWFRFYTITTWDDLFSHNPDFLADFVISRQIPEALLCGYNIVNKLIFYLYFQSSGIREMREIYAKFRDVFIRSEAILGRWEGSDYTLADAAQELALIKSRGRDAVEVASFMNKIRQIMYPTDGLTQLYFIANQDEVLGRLVETIDLFLDITPENIYTLVNLQIHPGLNEDMLLELASEDEKNLPANTVSRTWRRYIEIPEGDIAQDFEETKTESAPVAEKKIFDTPSVNNMAVIKPEPAKLAPTVKPAADKPAVENKKEEKPEPAPEKGVIVTVVPTHAEIRAKIDAAFEADKDGQYADLDHVLSALEKAAEKYHEPKIAELYYFDEASGKFKWSV